MRYDKVALLQLWLGKCENNKKLHVASSPSCIWPKLKKKILEMKFGEDENHYFYMYGTRVVPVHQDDCENGKSWIRGNIFSIYLAVTYKDRWCSVGLIWQLHKMIGSWQWEVKCEYFQFKNIPLHRVPGSLLLRHLWIHCSKGFAAPNIFTTGPV